MFSGSCADDYFASGRALQGVNLTSDWTLLSDGESQAEVKSGAFVLRSENSRNRLFVVLSKCPHKQDKHSHLAFEPDKNVQRT